MNLQDQLRFFQSMFPNQPKEHLMSLLRSLQTGKTPIYPESQSSRRDTYPAFVGDPRHTSIQSPKASPSPLEYLTPIQTQSSRSVIPPSQRNPSPVRSPVPVQSMAPTPSAPPQNPSLLEAKMERLQQQVEQFLAHAAAQGKRKPDPFDLLPTVKIPANCRLDYPKYNGTGDPAHH